VCKAVTEVIQLDIDNTEQRHNVQVRFRIDEKIHRPFARTEVRIEEIMEDVCRNVSKRFGVVSQPLDTPDADAGRAYSFVVRLAALEDGDGSRTKNLTKGKNVKRKLREVCSCA
jgi:hypothetical protein